MWVRHLVSTGTLSASRQSSTRSSRLSHVSSRAREALAFDEAEVDILRGSSVSKLLSCGGNVFLNSEGSAATYEMSHPVERITYFFSHNWSTSRHVKYFALLLHENLTLATVVSHLIVSLVLVFAFCGYYWHFGQESQTCVLVGSVLFCVCFYFGHTVRVRESIVFLDKTCIHQTNKERQRKGITKLGAFIANSDGLLAVMSDTYFSKLWTVYEFATYLLCCSITQQTPKLELVPDALPMGITGVQTFSWVYPSLHNMLRSAEGSWTRQLLQYAFLLCLVCFLALLIRRLHRQTFSNRIKLSKFSVFDAVCTVETDRSTVHNNMGVVMDVGGLAPRRSSLTEDGCLQATAAFGALVRKHAFEILPPSAIRPPGLSNVAILAMNSGMTFWGTDDIIIHTVLRDEGVAYSAVAVLRAFTKMLQIPIALFVVNFLSSCFLDTSKKWQDACWISFTGMAGTVAFIAVERSAPLLVVLGQLSEKDTQAALVHAAVLVLQVAFCCWIYRHRKTWQGIIKAEDAGDVDTPGAEIEIDMQGAELEIDMQGADIVNETVIGHTLHGQSSSNIGTPGAEIEDVNDMPGDELFFSM